MTKVNFYNIAEEGKKTILREISNRIGEVDYNLHQPQTINPVPIPEFIDEWKADYKTMQEQMIYGDSPSFDEMLKGIKVFVSKINELEWEMETGFPEPTTKNETKEND